MPGLEFLAATCQILQLVASAQFGFVDFGLPHLPAHECLCDKADACNLKCSRHLGMRRQFLSLRGIGHHGAIDQFIEQFDLTFRIFRRTAGLTGE